MNKQWCVYLHVNKVNQKVYVGRTCKKPEYRWNNGKGYFLQKHFWYAIQKYGWENFSHNIVADGLSDSESADLEKQLISEYQSMDPRNGYNQTAGGEGMLGWHHTSASKEKIRLSNHTRLISDETREKQSKAHQGKYVGEKNPFYGKTHSQDIKRQISESATKRWNDADNRKKMIKVLRSETRTKKISESKKNLWKDPAYRGSMKKIMNSAEYREKISRANKGRKHTAEELEKMKNHSTGEKNPMYGKCGSDNPNAISVIQCSKDGKELQRFGSIVEAATQTGISNGSIGQCCRGKLKTAGGYRWKYAKQGKGEQEESSRGR